MQSIKTKLFLLVILLLAPLTSDAAFSHNFLVISWTVSQMNWSGYQSTSAPTVSSQIDSAVSNSKVVVSLTTTRPPIGTGSGTWFTVIGGGQSVIPGYGEYVGTISGDTHFHGYLSTRPIDKLKINTIVLLDAPSKISIYRFNTDSPVATLTAGQSFTLSGSSYIQGGGPSSNVFPVLELPDHSYITACHGHYQDDTDVHSWVDQLTLCRDVGTGTHTAFTTRLFKTWPSSAGSDPFIGLGAKRVFVSITDPSANTGEPGVTTEMLGGKSDVFVITSQ